MLKPLLQTHMLLSVVYLKHYVSDETEPLLSSKILFIMIAEVVYVEKWLKPCLHDAILAAQAYHGNVGTGFHASCIM
jgi:hypothetical protein